MFASGVPTTREDHVEAAILAALDMLEVVKRAVTPEGIKVRVRIGIATGPVIAGVIGTTKFSFDGWGNTVNVASRMESQRVADRIQVTAEIAEKLSDRIDFEPRGSIEIAIEIEIEIKGKGKGAISTLLVKSCKSALLPSAVPQSMEAFSQRRLERISISTVVPGEEDGPVANRGNAGVELAGL
jgi:hypothetical protein